ncbi:conserved hypothetical protein [Vibrio crassostreae]|nr:conserved hypothetical protein [Vibrio crassostreae]CAK2996962.1 conserved hypothetical protein [Vibrio crassostreae]CAK3605557.1 conserved hypothetical protein [Vibrio crassostreae]
MSIKILLTLDLNNVTDEQREKVYESLKGDQWTKMSLTTTWKCTFNETVSEESARKTAKNDVLRAIDKAKIKSYEAALQAGVNGVEKF